MTKIICIANQKGGVGKTTTAINVGAGLALQGQKVLLADCDPQGNATTGLGLDKNILDYSLYHLLIGECRAAAVIQPTLIETLKLIPARTELIGFDVEMMAAERREFILKDVLGPLQADYDVILIDCPPALNLLTVNALTAAHTVIIPLQCEFYALEGLGQLMQTVQRIQQNLNPDLTIAGILLTMFDKRTNLASQVAQEARNYFKTQVFETAIPRNIRLGEAPSFGKPIMVYDAASAGARAYLALLDEIQAQSPNQRNPV